MYNNFTITDMEWTWEVFLCVKAKPWSKNELRLTDLFYTITCLITTWDSSTPKRDSKYTLVSLDTFENFLDYQWDIINTIYYNK